MRYEGAMKRVPSVALVALASLLLACLCDPVPTPPSRPALPDDKPLGVSGAPLWPDGGVELGLAQYPVDFMPFPERFTFEHGPQGGIHVQAAYRINGHSFSTARFVLRVRREADGLLVHESTLTSSSELSDGGAEVLQQRLLLCPPPEMTPLVGVPLQLELTVIGPGQQFLGQTRVRASTDEPDCL